METKKKYKIPSREKLIEILERRVEAQQRWMESLHKKYGEQQVNVSRVAEEEAVYETT